MKSQEVCPGLCCRAGGQHYRGRRKGRGGGTLDGWSQQVTLREQVRRDQEELKVPETGSSCAKALGPEEPGTASYEACVAGAEGGRGMGWGWGWEDGQERGSSPAGTTWWVRTQNL